MNGAKAASIRVISWFNWQLAQLFQKNAAMNSQKFDAFVLAPGRRPQVELLQLSLGSDPAMQLRA
jgi:hypothetical protein